MSSKKKLVISLSVAAAVLVAAVIAIVAVFAAANQTVATSQIKVSYKAEANVVGSVSAKYQLQGGTQTSMTTDGKTAGQNNASILFNVDDDATGALSLQTTDLDENGALPFSKDVRWVVFEYTFVNTGSYDYTANLTETNFSKDNMLVEYATAEEYAKGEEANWGVKSTVNVAAPTTIGDSVQVKYYARIMIDNVAFDASFAGIFTWDLEAVTPTEG